MSSSSTPVASSSDRSFFSKSKYHTPGSSTVVTTRVVPVLRSPDSRAPAPALKVTAQPRPSTKPGRKADPFKRRNADADEYTPNKKRRVTPEISRGVPARELRTHASSLTASPAANELVSTPSTRATSVASTPPPPPPPPRECWIDEKGDPGLGFLSSEEVVRDLMKGYVAYFKNPDDPTDRSFDPHPTDYPCTVLEYPNTGACERFILLAPKDKDHYNPIMCLESTLRTIIEHYLTPSQRALFGSFPTTDDNVPETEYPTTPSEAPSPPSSTYSPSESSASSSQCSHFSFDSDTSATSVSSLSSICALSAYATRATPDRPPTVNYLGLLQQAINTENGPLFLDAMNAINALLHTLKHPPVPVDLFDPQAPNQLCAAVKSWTQMPSEVVQRVIDETYQRAVGPHVHKLTRYEAFSSEVYGELMPPFVSDIVRATRLREGMLFLDLGAGVGNVVLQAALETGCRAYGIEIKEEPARIGQSQLAQFRTRCRMWGLRMGEAELERGDMLKSEKVDRLVREADVVLVNNKVFLEPLNEALRQKFLDLKEGAVVVSLKCLMGSVRSTARNSLSRERSASPALRERNLDDIGEIFTVTARPYHPGSVSWGGAGGEYFLQRMNREEYARRIEQFESARGGLARATRSRR
ncbi:S-adenosyl-L-methionine-dependent methyltransferase [Trametes elegans]|nr:S-adenosyl-L-methionine-dependent methyltransferase [Trametes elegans]